MPKPPNRSTPEALAVAICVSFGWASSNAGETARRVETGRATTWTRWEQSLTSTSHYANPYREVTLTVRFTNSTGVSLSSYGYWDGGDTFKVRFMFPRKGTWTWTTNCSDTSNSGLHGRKGAVRVAEYVGANPLYKNDYLTVSANKRYLTHANGTPFLWIGDTAWRPSSPATGPLGRDTVWTVRVSASPPSLCTPARLPSSGILPTGGASSKRLTLPTTRVWWFV